MGVRRGRFVLELIQELHAGFDSLSWRHDEYLLRVTCTGDEDADVAASIKCRVLLNKLSTNLT